MLSENGIFGNVGWIVSAKLVAVNAEGFTNSKSTWTRCRLLSEAIASCRSGVRKYESARALQLRRTNQLFLNCDQIDRARSMSSLAEDDAMRIQIEVFGPQTFQNPVIVFVVDENP